MPHRRPDSTPFASVWGLMDEDREARRRFDSELSWAIDWLAIALDSRNEPEAQRAVRAALAIIERRTMDGGHRG